MSQVRILPGPQTSEVEGDHVSWFRTHPWITGYLAVSIAWALWSIARSSMKPRWGSVLLQILLSPLLLPLALMRSRSKPWMGLRWKCPNCAWAMFDEVCEECGADGLPYDPETHRVIEDEDP